MYEVLFTSYQMGKTETHFIQRYIQGLEAVFESSIQCIIQLVYLQNFLKKNKF